MKAIIYYVLVLLCVAAVGCSSPASRIKRNPELFASFPVEAQGLIEQGQVDIGFTPEMTRMALGEPNRVYQRRTGDGSMEVWSYTSRRVTTDRQRVTADFSYRDSDGRVRRTSDTVWVDVDRELEYERMRVEFTDGKVSAIETLDR
jgi:hypothetical protein